MTVQAVLPPGPKVNPLSLIADFATGGPLLVTNPLKYFEDLHREYGNLVFSDLGIGRFYITNNLALIRKVFVSEPRSYAKADAYKEAAHFLGNGILNSEGDFWQSQRQMVQPAFTRSRLGSFVSTMVDVSDRAIAVPGSVADVSALAMHLALENICRFLFGEDFSANERTIREAVHFGNSFISSRIQAPLKLPVYFPSLNNLRFLWHRFELDQILYRIIDERAQRSDAGSDLLGMLLKAERERNQGKIRRTQVRDEILTLLIAGHETTGFTLAMALWLIARHPQVQENLRDEISAHGAGESVDGLEKSQLLEAVVNETLRLYPAAWIIGRRIVADEEFEGYLLRKDSQLQTGIIALHRNPQYWSAPASFRPERFLGETPEPVQKQAFMPFGAGPRRCIGSMFAMLEMQVAIARILRRYRISAPDNNEPQINYLFTSTLKNPLPLHFEPL
ncbi:MAG TPA: cytochrome P450 [Turneriella sp.]|nr:cytochrome P450 [Turneriella sp.]HNL10644.1 cytochrome P450 [Turneriella sp.]